MFQLRKTGIDTERDRAVNYFFGNPAERSDILRGTRKLDNQ